MEKNAVTLATAGVGAILYFLFGEFDIALQCLLVFIALDYISGIIKAFTNKELSSKSGFRGILKKVGILIIVAVGVLVDRITGDSGAVRSLVIYYFVANEGLSIIENLSQTGLPIPKSIKNALKILKNQGDGKV